MLDKLVPDPARSRELSVAVPLEQAGRPGTNGLTTDLGLILLLALAVRLLGLPFATADSWDHAARIWAAWRWIDDPFPLTWGVWGPLHYVLMGPVIRLFGPSPAPTLLHVAIGSLVPPLVYLFTRREFGRRAGALVAGVAAALAPVAILNSLSVRSETPFAVLILAAMLALSQARRARSVPWAAAAGLALTLAAGLRYEAWLLTPFLAVLLWPRWPAVAVFVAAALVWPAIAMASNFAVYGDPLYGVTFASQHELHRMGTAAMSLPERLDRVGKFATALVSGLTPMLALVAAAGTALCLWERRRSALWLIPPSCLAALLFLAVLRGSLVPKMNYTETLALFILPFTAAALDLPALRRRGSAATLALCTALFASMAFLLVVGTLRRMPAVRERSVIVDKVSAESPVPTFKGQTELADLLATVRPVLAESPERGFVQDFIGFVPRGYLALSTLVHPDRIYSLPQDLGAADRAEQEPRSTLPLRARTMPLIGNEPPALEDFLRRYREGVLVIGSASRAAAWLGLSEADGTAGFRGLDLRVEELGRVSVPMPDELRPGGAKQGERLEVIAYRYREGPPSTP